MRHLPTHVRQTGPALVIALVLGLLSVGCAPAATSPSVGASAPTASASGGSSGLDGTWTLTNYAGVNGTNVPVPSGIPLVPTITFAGEAVTGNAGCNTFVGTATVGTPTLSGTSVSFGQIVTTKKACEGPAADVETAVLLVLNAATQATVSGNTLEITGPSGKPAMTFTRS